MEYRLIRSKRKTIELSIGDDFVPVIKAPKEMSTAEINAFAEKHKKWTEKHISEKIEHEKRFAFSEEEKANLEKNALGYLTERTKYYSKITGLEPTGIKITSAKKRFGSCSGRNSICYAKRLMLYPPEAIDYVVVHELCHIVHKNHSRDFYKMVESILPDYKKREKMLK